MSTKTFIHKWTVDDSQYKRGMSGIQKQTNGFASSLKSLGPMIAAAFSVTAIVSWTKSSIEGLDKQQKAEQKLLTALKGRADVQKRLIDSASDLQQITLFGDETTIEAYAQLAAFVKNEEALKRLMPLVQDMATAMGMDLVSAAQLVGKSLGSSTNALKRYGIQIDGAVGSNERLNSAVTALSEKFAGQATAATQSALGASEQLSNAWGDLSETIVSMLAPSLTKLAMGMNDAVTAMDALLKSKSLDWWDKIRILLMGAAGSAAGVADVVADNYDPAVENATETTKEFNDQISDTGEISEDFAAKLDEVARKAKEAADSITKLALAGSTLATPFTTEVTGMKPITNTVPVTTPQQTTPNLYTANGQLVIEQSTDALVSYMDTLQQVALSESNFSDSHSGFAENMIDVNAKMVENMQKALNTLSMAFSNAIADVILGEKSFEDAMMGLLNSLLRTVIQMVATYLIQTIAASIAHGASKGGAIGAAAEGAAALGIFSAMVPSFAEGGIVSGPTLAYVGEYAGASQNPEVIAPLDKLESMISVSSNLGVGNWIVKGEDIAYVVNRQNAKTQKYR